MIAITTSNSINVNPRSASARHVFFVLTFRSPALIDSSATKKIQKYFPLQQIKHQGHQNASAYDNAVNAESIERMRLHVTKKPFDRDERNPAGNHRR